MKWLSAACAVALLAIVAAPIGEAQQARETLKIPREHGGQKIEVMGELFLPAGTQKVPAMMVQHGSGGVAEREHRYARAIVEIGVAAFVIDSFKARGVHSSVRDQHSVSTFEMLDDAYSALKVLSVHPRIEPSAIGIVGFSKGGSVALLAAHERRAVRALPLGPRFALHVPFYPACTTHYLHPKTTGAPIYLLIGGADTYAGVAPCKEYAAKLAAEGAQIETKVFPGAPHGFDGDQSYKDPKGENWSRCVVEEQADGAWKERTSGITTDANGRRIEDAYNKAIAACRTLGVSGGPDAAAKAQSMTVLKDAIRKHLLKVVN